MEQPRSNDSPEENSKPDADDVVELVPEVVRPIARLASPLEAPPVRPFPALTAVISPEELDDEEIVIVEPEVETDVPPEPEIVKAPEVLLIVVTIWVVSKETVGFWPVVTAIPVPAVIP